MWTYLLKHWWKVIQVSLFLFWLKWISEKLIFWKVTIVFESAGAQSVTKLSPGLLTFTNKQSSTPRSLLQTDFIWSKDLPTEYISKLLYFLFHFYDLNLIAEVDDESSSMTNNKIFAGIINCLIEFTILKCVRLVPMLRLVTYDFTITLY